jgi:hypothetical protein
VVRGVQKQQTHIWPKEICHPDTFLAPEDKGPAETNWGPPWWVGESEVKCHFRYLYNGLFELLWPRNTWKLDLKKIEEKKRIGLFVDLLVKFVRHDCFAKNVFSTFELSLKHTKNATKKGTPDMGFRKNVCLLFFNSPYQVTPKTYS